MGCASTGSKGGWPCNELNSNVFSIPCRLGSPVGPGRARGKWGIGVAWGTFRVVTSDAAKSGADGALRIGVIGVGVMGSNHARVLSEFVGIEEKGAAHFALRTEPQGEVTLPQELSDPYQELVAAVERAAQRGSTAADLTHGHALAADPDARAIQESFVKLVPKHLLEIRDVLRNSADTDQRAMATTLIGYTREKAKVVPDLEFAMQDPDENVRASAMDALSAIAVLAAKQPDLRSTSRPPGLSKC